MTQQEFEAMQSGLVCFEAVHTDKNTGICTVVFLDGTMTTFSYL